MELNRAVALSMAFGPAVGLELVAVPAVEDYHLLPSVRGDLLAGSAASTRPVSSSSARRR